MDSIKYGGFYPHLIKDDQGQQALLRSSELRRARQRSRGIGILPNGAKRVKKYLSRRIGLHNRDREYALQQKSREDL